MENSRNGGTVREQRRKVLFLCGHNACRSQMAEGFLRAMAQGDFDAFSAGSEPTEVHPVAIEVMGEVGIDISDHVSKAVTVYDGREFDFVVTVCKEGACPVFSGRVTDRLAWAFEDPALVTGTDIEIREAFRLVRDEIGSRVGEFVEEQALRR